MSKSLLGLWVGAILGLLDGLSAWFSPEARPMMLAIVAGSTVKGVVTGLLAGLIARWRHSVALGVGAGVAVGFGLSSVAAIGQGGHYWEIVLPGMLVGALVGFVTQRYPKLGAGARPASTGMSLVLALALPVALVANVQPSTATDSLAPVERLVGKWTGTSEGQPGTGKVEREYERVFGTRFIQVRNRSIYLPQEKNPKGETHEDIGFVSFDSMRKRIVFRQFHSEGFVNQYVMESTSTPDRLVFTTEAIENIPPGFRARETYILTGSVQLEEVFEIAEPGKEFEVYSRSRLIRAR
jgi:THAP4-like, heme-binding beta-barrel domain